jgi:hypothetical protein
MGQEGVRERHIGIVVAPDLAIGVIRSIGDTNTVRGKGVVRDRSTGDAIDPDLGVVNEVADALDLVIPSRNILQKTMTTSTS